MEKILSIGLLDTPQKSTLTFQPTGLDISGNPVGAKIANPSWAVDNSDVAPIAPSSDNSSCDVKAGADGVALVTLTGNPLNKDGSANVSKTLTAQVQVTVTAGVVEATLLNISASEPVDVAAPAADAKKS